MNYENYTLDELAVLNNKVCFCFYSWCQHEILFFNSTAGNRVPVFVDKFLMDYYLDRFFLEISELYTYFWNRKDAIILEKFIATEEERLKLKEVRTKIAHVDGDLQKTVVKIKEFTKITERDNQILDLFEIIKYTRVLLRHAGKEHFLVNRLKVILNLYPPNLIKESFLEEILN